MRNVERDKSRVNQIEISPVWSYSPVRTGRLDRSSHAHVARVTPPTVREVRLPFVSLVYETADPFSNVAETNSSVRSVVSSETNLLNVGLR